MMSVLHHCTDHLNTGGHPSQEPPHCNIVAILLGTRIRTNSVMGLS